jgi:hypothetical protein
MGQRRPLPARTVKVTPGDHDTSALTDKATRYRETDTGRATHDADPLSLELP